MSTPFVIKRVIYSILLLLVLAPAAGTARVVDDGEDNGPLQCSPTLNIGTNLLYDAAAMPSIGIELGLARRLSLAASATYGWYDGWPFKDRVRAIAADAELRYWTARSCEDKMRGGLHFGAYGAIYRYDFLFGHKGQEAKANWGAGLTLGYSVPLGKRFSLDLGVGAGYVSGKYKEYEVSRDSYRHNVWMADKIRHYVGPTKAEASLVWHLGSIKKKGGAR